MAARKKVQSFMAGGGRPVSPSKGEALRMLQSVRDWSRHAVTCFEGAQVAYGQSSVGAWDEAMQLVRGVLRLPPDAPDLLGACLCMSERQRVIALIEQRIQTRRPLAYLTGSAWFGGLRLLCDDRALVPRSLLVEILLDPFPRLGLDFPEPASVLDLCTGGGSLAMLAANAFPKARIVGCDLSPGALDLAKENRDQLGLTRRIALRQGDLFASLHSASLTGWSDPVPFPELPTAFDLIICNPPYVTDHSMECLPMEFRAEPRLGLAGGTDGMKLVRRVVESAPRFLRPGGLLLLEIGHEAENFEAAFPHLPFRYLPVSAGDRMVVLVEGLASQGGPA